MKGDAPGPRFVGFGYLLSVEEADSPLQRVASPDVAVALQQRSGVAPAFGRRRYTSGASSAARGSITRAARASLRKELSGRCQRGDGFSRSVGCQSGQDEATGRVHDENEQRGHCSAQLSDAVAVLLTALTAVKRGVAPHCWLEKVLAAARSRARGDHHTSRGREPKPCGLSGAAAGAPGRRARRVGTDSSDGH